MVLLSNGMLGITTLSHSDYPTSSQSSYFILRTQFYENVLNLTIFSIALSKVSNLKTF